MSQTKVQQPLGQLSLWSIHYKLSICEMEACSFGASVLSTAVTHLLTLKFMLLFGIAGCHVCS